MFKIVITALVFLFLVYAKNWISAGKVLGRISDTDQLQKSVIFTVNNGFAAFPETDKTKTDDDFQDVQSTFKSISDSFRKDEVEDVNYLSSKSVEPTAETTAIEIPEKNWPDSHRVRRALTEEIAIKYPGGKFVPRKVENNTWGVGEHLTFSIDYSFYRAGTATMVVMGTEHVNGGIGYHIKTTARSNKFISKFYKVRDTVSSYMDTEGLFSRRFEKQLSEGKYKSDRLIDFYQDRLIALNTTEKYAITEIPLYVSDILSALYVIRTYDLEVGKDEIINVYADGKVYPLRVIVHKIEKVKVPAGEFECFVVEPVLKSEGLFRRKGRLIIWLTNDKHKLPVKMTSKVIIGNIGSNLEKFTLGEIRGN